MDATTDSGFSRTQTLLARLESLSSDCRAHAAEADRIARLPPHIAAALVSAGLFRLWVPQRFDGLELTLPEALEVYEAAARIDGSVGWAVMIGSGGGLFAAYLEPHTARSLFAPSKAVIAGSGAPGGHAARMPGGYRASGAWRYASGASYATTFTANCLVTKGGSVVQAEDGSPLVRAMAFDASQVTVRPSWNTSGMRGTGSDDFEVQDAFVPEERSFSVFTDSPREPGPLYSLPFAVLTELPVASVALGIARHALEAFDSLVRQKKSVGSRTAMSQDPFIQARFAEAHATWQGARSTLGTLATKTWRTALERRSLSSRELADITACCVLSVAHLRAATAELIAVSGMNGIQIDDELARAWRDLQTVAAHASVSPRNLTGAGAALLAT